MTGAAGRPSPAPIGWVRSTRSEAVDDEWDAETSWIELDPDVLGPDAVAGLDDFSHIEVVFLFDRADPVAVERAARHPRGDPRLPLVGILAQRGKDRPNHLGLARCRLDAVEGMTLRVRDLDAIDGTPVMDIKPWMAEFGPRGTVRQPSWSKELMRHYWSPDVEQTEETLRGSYDRVAGGYADHFRRELDEKPLDRAVLGALAEASAGGPVLDVGCGPGQAARWLAGTGHATFGCDLSLGMCRQAAMSGVAPACGDMAVLPFRDSIFAGLVSLYAVIHLGSAARQRAYAEFRRVLRPGGQALIAFHTSDPETATGGVVHRSDWLGQQVDLVFRYLDPAAEVARLESAGFSVVAHLERAPLLSAEHPSRRSYLLLKA